MLRMMFKSKIHRATVTEANVNYAGSITVDSDLLRAADILEHEQVAVVNVTTGARFETYTIAGAPGSGVVCLNGGAARLAQLGDLVIIISYAQMSDAELVGYQPIVVLVNAENQQMMLNHP